VPTEEQLRQLYEQCVERHAASLYRVAYRLTGRRDRADELVQETYLHAWRSLPSLRDPEKIRAWMFSILRKRLAKTRRQMIPMNELSTHRVEDLTDARERGPGPDPDVEWLQAAINSLDDEHKFPLLLVSMEGLTTDEAATILKIPRGTVLSRLHRAREKIRNAAARESTSDSTTTSIEHPFQRNAP
jgi:RNA polymerase sigma-70 factor (ECF subfamily)